MVADIIPFKPRFTVPCPYGAFRKALMAVLILADFEIREIGLIIAIWMARGLVTEDEAHALGAFFNLEQE